MPRYLDPKADLIFKKIFGEHPKLLQNFLNAILPLSPERQILSLEYLPTEQVPQIPTFKRSIVDVKCRDLLRRGGFAKEGIAAVTQLSLDDIHLLAQSETSSTR